MCRWTCFTLAVGRTSGGSAPNSPAKSLTASKFKRSLSFGAMRGGVGKTVGIVVGGVSGDAGTGGEGASTSSGANAATTCNSCSSSGSDSSSKQQPQQSTVVARPCKCTCIWTQYVYVQEIEIYYSNLLFSFSPLQCVPSRLIIFVR